MSPVDVFRPADLEKQASADFTDQLATIAPSFNTQRFPIADGTAFVRPANLRNLPPDQTLVLINGKRRHRSALVNLQVEPFGTVNQGSQAVDYSLIPSAAIQRVEVLRDGSSAQYGSDAIAGVINVLLNDYSEGVRIDGQYGSTYEGDGDKWRTSINFGVPLAGDGFFNMTAEYFDSDFTSRGIPRADAAQVGAFVGTDLVPFEGLGQRWGDPNGKGLRSFFNGEIPINESISLYGFGSYADTEYDSSFFYRTPVGVPGVTARTTLLVDNVNNATGASGADGLPDPVAQSIIDDIRARGLNPSDFVTAESDQPVRLRRAQSDLPAVPGRLHADLRCGRGGLRGRVRRQGRDRSRPALGLQPAPGREQHGLQPDQLDQSEPGHHQSDQLQAGRSDPVRARRQRRLHLSVGEQLLRLADQRRLRRRMA
jgi:iron complex outermembrane receptor protein